MVKRTTLDPIEEARARVRLKYLRARAERAPMKQIGIAADRIGRKSGAKKLPPLQVLKARWRDIAGETLYKYCRPERLSGGKDGRVLTLRVLPQAAPIVQHQSETIRERVSIAAGGDVVSIRLVQGPLTDAAPAVLPRHTRSLTRQERADLVERASRIEDPRLRAAIVALGTAMLTAADDEPERPAPTARPLPF